MAQIYLFMLEGYRYLPGTNKLQKILLVQIVMLTEGEYFLKYLNGNKPHLQMLEVLRRLRGGFGGCLPSTEWQNLMWDSSRLSLRKALLQFSNVHLQWLCSGSMTKALGGRAVSGTRMQFTIRTKRTSEFRNLQTESLFWISFFNYLQSFQKY